MKKVLPKTFFNRDSVKVARELLGKFLVRRLDGEVVASMITEVEVYDGFRDKASHAARGKTPRNTPMFGASGNWYVYFTYGIHWMLNIVTREAGYPAAILIRGVAIAQGPARLTKKLHINRALNGLPAHRTSGLWIEDRGVKVSPRKIKTAARVGVDYAGPYWARRALRFFISA